MRILVSFLALLLCFQARGLDCRRQFIFTSGLNQTEFDQAMAPLLADVTINRVPWLTVEVQPKVFVARPPSPRGETEAAILKTISCCGMTDSEVRAILNGLNRSEDGSFSLQAYLEAAYLKAGLKFGRDCGKDCMLTALTHMHYEFQELGKPSTNHEAVEHFMNPVVDRSSLSWGDIWVLRDKSNGKVIHVCVNLANGLVLNKPGMGPARIEPLSSAMALYTHNTSSENLEVWRKKTTAPPLLKDTFHPEKQKRPWWSFLFSVD